MVTLIRASFYEFGRGSNGPVHKDEPCKNDGYANVYQWRNRFMRYEPPEDSPDRQQIGDRNSMRGGDVSEEAVVEEVCDAAACESENEDRQNRCEVEGCWMRANSGYRHKHEGGECELRYREAYRVEALQLSFGNNSGDCVAECRQYDHNDAENGVAALCGFPCG